MLLKTLAAKCNPIRNKAPRTCYARKHTPCCNPGTTKFLALGRYL